MHTRLSQGWTTVGGEKHKVDEKRDEKREMEPNRDKERDRERDRETCGGGHEVVKGWGGVQSVVSALLSHDQTQTLHYGLW